jgi:predicted permease
MNLSLGTSVRPDAAVLGFTLVLCILASVIFSLWPALSASRRDLVHGLKQIGSEPTASDRFGRFFSGRHVLEMAQISLSLMLLFSSGLFLRGALMAGGFDLGFEPRGGLVAELDFSLGKASEREAKAATFAALDRIRALPGVRSAGVTTITPYGYHHDVASVAPASAAALRRPEDSGIDSWITRTTPDYLSTIGLRLLSGRDFTSAEATASAPAGVAIIDESLARQLFPKGGALGQRLKYTDWSAREAEVVGVCTPHRQNPNEQDEHRGHLFVPLSENYSFASATVFLQARLATTDREAIRQAIASIRSALRGMNPELPLVQVLPFSELVDGNIESWLIRIGAALFGVFGAIALVLAVIGVYSVKAYAVSRQTREIGIRMALGAGPRQILGLVLTQGALQTAFALGLGTLLALGAGRLLRSILYHVSPNDPIVLLASASLLAVAAMLACLVPARRATRVDPMVTLRAE